MTPRLPETPRKQTTVGGRVTKAKGSNPKSSRSSTTKGRKLRYGPCPTCKIGILERKRNNPEGAGPDAGLWRLSCSRYTARPPCRHYEAFNEDPQILWAQKQNELGKGPCPECHIGQLVERVKNPFEYTEKYAECSRRGEEDGCNYIWPVIKGKAVEAVKGNIETVEAGPSKQDNGIKMDQNSGDMNGEAGNSKDEASNNNNPATIPNHIEAQQPVIPETRKQTRGTSKSIHKHTAEDLSGIKTGDSMEHTTAKASSKGKVKVTIDLTLDEEDENDETKFGSVSACYPAPANVYPARTRLFQSASPQNLEGMQAPITAVSTSSKSGLIIPSGHHSTLVTPAKSPNSLGHSPFSVPGKPAPTSNTSGRFNTPTKSLGMAGQQPFSSGMVTPTSNRPNKTFVLPPTLPQKRGREDDEKEKFDIDTGLKDAMIELADQLDTPVPNSKTQPKGQVNTTPTSQFTYRTSYHGNNPFNSYNATPVRNQFNRPSNNQPNNDPSTQANYQPTNQFAHPPSTSVVKPTLNPVCNTDSDAPTNPWDIWEAHRLTNSQFLNNNAGTKDDKPPAKRQKRDEFDDSDLDDNDFMALAEQTEGQSFGGKR